MTKEKGEMTFLEHLEELRWHLVRSVIAIVVCAIAAFIFKEVIFDYILFAPKSPDFLTNRILCHVAELTNIKSLCFEHKPLELYNFELAGQFKTHMMVSLYAGLVLAAPIVFFEIWKFIAPALNDKERKNARGAVFVISFLFFTGILFGFFVIIPFSLNFLTSYEASTQIIDRPSISSYFSLVISLTLASGIIFELPIAAYFLSKIGLLTPKFMVKYWRHAIIIILIIAAIITPPDVISQILVSIPLIILYWASIIISARVEKKRAQKLSTE